MQGVLPDASSSTPSTCSVQSLSSIRKTTSRERTLASHPIHPNNISVYPAYRLYRRRTERSMLRMIPALATMPIMRGLSRRPPLRIMAICPYHGALHAARKSIIKAVDSSAYRVHYCLEASPRSWGMKPSEVRTYATDVDGKRPGNAEHGDGKKESLQKGSQTGSQTANTTSDTIILTRSYFRGLLSKVQKAARTRREKIHWKQLIAKVDMIVKERPKSVGMGSLAAAFFYTLAMDWAVRVFNNNIIAALSPSSYFRRWVFPQKEMVPEACGAGVADKHEKEKLKKETDKTSGLEKLSWHHWKNRIENFRVARFGSGKGELSKDARASTSWS